MKSPQDNGKKKVPKYLSCQSSREQSVYIREVQKTLGYFFKMKPILANVSECIQRFVITWEEFGGNLVVHIWKTKQKEKSFGKLKDCAGKVIYNMDQL